MSCVGLYVDLLTMTNVVAKKLHFVAISNQNYNCVPVRMSWKILEFIQRPLIDLWRAKLFRKIYRDKPLKIPFNFHGNQKLS